MSKKKNKQKPIVHEEISGFDIKINEFGELTTNMKIDKINDFLKDKLVDKKLKNDSEEE